MNYKQGDKVKIRKDLKIDNVYGGLNLNEMMHALCGMTLTIKDKPGEGFYRFVETNFTLSDAMIEGLADEPTRYKVGQKVNVRKDLKIGNDYDGLTFSYGMEDYRGTVQPIVSITVFDNYKFDNTGWVFNDAMIEGLADCITSPERIQPISTRPEPSRLEIAAMAMQGMLACPNRDLRYDSIDKFISECYEYADALIKECNKQEE